MRRARPTPQGAPTPLTMAKRSAAAVCKRPAAAVRKQPAAAARRLAAVPRRLAAAARRPAAAAAAAAAGVVRQPLPEECFKYRWIVWHTGKGRWLVQRRNWFVGMTVTLQEAAGTLATNPRQAQWTQLLHGCAPEVSGFFCARCATQVLMACAAFQVTAEELLRRPVATTCASVVSGATVANVRFCSTKQRWRVQVQLDGVRKNLYRDIREEAVCASVGFQEHKSSP